MGADTILFLSVIFPICKGLHKFGYFLNIPNGISRPDGGTVWNFGFAQSAQNPTPFPPTPVPGRSG